MKTQKSIDASIDNQGIDLIPHINDLLDRLSVLIIFFETLLAKQISLGGDRKRPQALYCVPEPVWPVQISGSTIWAV